MPLTFSSVIIGINFICIVVNLFMVFKLRAKTKELDIVLKALIQQRIREYNHKLPQDSDN